MAEVLIEVRLVTLVDWCHKPSVKELKMMTLGGKVGCVIDGQQGSIRTKKEEEDTAEKIAEQRSPGFGPQTIAAENFKRTGLHSLLRNFVDNLLVTFQGTTPLGYY